MSSDQAHNDDAPLRDELQHREREIQAIRRITAALFQHSTTDDMLRETLKVAIEVLQADVGSIQMYETVQDALVFRYVMDPRAQNLAGFSYPTSQGIGGRVFRTGISDITNKVSDRSEFNRSVDDLTGYQTESILTAPLKRAEGAPIGIVQILNARRPFDQRDLEVLEVLSAQAAASIEMASLIERARKAELITIIGDISHDIKNMLTPIESGMLTLQPMLDDMFEDLEGMRSERPEDGPWIERMANATEMVRDYYTWILEGAIDSVIKLRARTREIANAVKGESTPPYFEAVNINDIVEAVLRTLRPVAEQSGLQLIADCDPAMPPAELDRHQMDNALYNLVNNAIPETPPGGSIIVRTRGPETGQEAGVNPTLLIEVADTGKGIPAHIRERLFTDAAITTKPDGTGLGTRIVGDIVRRHKGQITVASEEGKGTTFSIRLPLAQDAV